MKSLEVVVGAQYGSEAKGHVTDRLVKRALGGFADQRVVNVRVAGPNAGHTVYDAAGKSWALRQVPVGAVAPGPVHVVIAPGSEIDRGVLLSELESLRLAGHLQNKVVWVSQHATLIEDEHKIAEISGTQLVEKIGSTGKGIGAARAGRIMRQASRVGDDPTFLRQLNDLGVHLNDYNYGPTDRVIVEGTQGYGLGLHGAHYPQCTSSDCRAIDFLAMAGINPWGEKVDVWAVARRFPIRVAGNSGWMYAETTWGELGLPPEYTTVTKKMRRVGHWDQALVTAAVQANGGGAHVKLALTMMDQGWPEIAGLNSMDSVLTHVNDLRGFTAWGETVRDASRANIGMMTTGPETGFFL